MLARAYSLTICANGCGRAIEEGLSTHQAAARFSVGVSTQGPPGMVETTQVRDYRPGFARWQSRKARY